MFVLRTLRAGRVFLSVAPVLGLFGLMYWGMGRREAVPAEAAYLPRMAEYPRVEAAFLHDQYRAYQKSRAACPSKGRLQPEARRRLQAAIRAYNDEAADCCPAAFALARTPAHIPLP